jgi:ferric-dicitrate binding protein FerR (iron transport regulator)
MKVTETMIEGFFRNELNEYQHSLVKDYFRQHPEALQEYLTDQSWEDFNTNEEVATPVADKMFHIIEAGAYRKNRIRRIYIQAASVAAALLIITIGYHSLTTRKVTGAQPPAAPENSVARVVPEWKDEINRTGKTKKISLKDGSEVELAEGGVLHYRESFAPDKRDIYLTGSAVFKVEKDAARPFTVYAGNVHVTALGTVFKVVTSGDENKKTEVQLLSGKVVVRPDSFLTKKGIKETYLDPGQLLLLDKQRFTMTVFRPGDDNVLDFKKLANPALKKTYTFDNESLTDIFSALSADYRIRFVYKRDILKDMTFTGKFNNQKETLENFLSTIAILNNLTIKKGKNSIYIKQ